MSKLVLPFSCVPAEAGCGRKFSTSKGLSLHKNHCKATIQLWTQVTLDKPRKRRKHRHLDDAVNLVGGGEGSLALDNLEMVYAGTSVQATDYQDVDIPEAAAFPFPPTGTLPVPAHPQCVHRLPHQFVDKLPEAEPAVVTATSDEPTPIIPRVRLIVHDAFKTMTNAFHIFRFFPNRPSYDPEALVSPVTIMPWTPRTTSIIHSTGSKSIIGIHRIPNPGFYLIFHIAISFTYFTYVIYHT
ncbi:hypothetical protein IW261DRAFT_1575057 [Armillaria novae-zelandiae]|uniref:Uncharacterized protein n=1 Tax=Armillaria novae-zelandiae TaxID=153914 RepID=A0AA39U2C7_9AGAR|nr:hypothetical protein IW261DRAFT_1575057 [Armillaria novae-zelandiae]